MGSLPALPGAEKTQSTATEQKRSHKAIAQILGGGGVVFFIHYALIELLIYIPD